jgi:hypothetical protein
MMVTKKDHNGKDEKKDNDDEDDNNDPFGPCRHDDASFYNPW